MPRALSRRRSTRQGVRVAEPEVVACTSAEDSEADTAARRVADPLEVDEAATGRTVSEGDIKARAREREQETAKPRQLPRGGSGRVRLR